MRVDAKTNSGGPRADRLRRKLRALKDAQRRAQSIEQVSLLAPALGQITKALAAAVGGYELCARRTRDAKVAIATTNAASSLKMLLAAMVSESATYGVDVAAHAGRTSDRMRWEWLASTGAVMDGFCDSRILDECAKILGAVIGLDVSPLGDAYASKVRLASAEAWSLAAAVAPRRGFALAAIA